eukprot:s175_g1.t5
MTAVRHADRSASVPLPRRGTSRVEVHRREPSFGGPGDLAPLAEVAAEVEVPRTPPEVTWLRRMLREHREAQQARTLPKRRSLQRPMYPMWKPLPPYGRPVSELYQSFTPPRESIAVQNPSPHPDTAVQTSPRPSQHTDSRMTQTSPHQSPEPSPQLASQPSLRLGYEQAVIGSQPSPQPSQQQPPMMSDLPRLSLSAHQSPEPSPQLASQPSLHQEQAVIGSQPSPQPSPQQPPMMSDLPRLSLSARQSPEPSPQLASQPSLRLGYVHLPSPQLASQPSLHQEPAVIGSQPLPEPSPQQPVMSDLPRPSRTLAEPTSWLTQSAHQSPQPSPQMALGHVLEHTGPAMSQPQLQMVDIRRPQQPVPAESAPLSSQPRLSLAEAATQQSPQPSQASSVLVQSLSHRSPAIQSQHSPQPSPEQPLMPDLPQLSLGEACIQRSQRRESMSSRSSQRPSQTAEPAPWSSDGIQPFLAQMLEMQQRQLQLLESMAKTKASGGEVPEAVPQATEPLQEQVSGLRDAVVQQSQMLHHFLARVDGRQAEVPAPSRATAPTSAASMTNVPGVVHQLGHLQVIEEQLLDLKASGDAASARGKDAHQVYRELLLLQDLQRQLQDLGTSEASTSRGSVAARREETLPAACPRFGAGGADWRGSCSQIGPRFKPCKGVSADAVQWGDLQLQLHEQLETLRQKQRSQTLEVKSPEAEFMKRQQDSLAERLMSAGFIADLGVSGSTRPPASPSRTRQDSEDTEQVRDSEVTTPEVSQLMSLPPSQASLPCRRPAQRPEYFQMSPEAVEDSRLRSSHGSHGSQDGVEGGAASDAEDCQQSFVLSPGRHLRPAGPIEDEGTLPAPPAFSRIEPGKDMYPEAADTVVLRASRDSLSSISRHSEVSRQSPEPHPVPHPSPSFGWKAYFMATQRSHKFSSMQCDFACMANYGPGASFGYMGIATMGATSGATCAIATDVPTEGFRVTSTTALAQKLTCSSGDIEGSTEDEMWYAEEVSVSCAATTTGTTTSGDTTVTHTVTSTSTAVNTVDANGAKTLTCWGIGMAIYSWL